MNACALPRDLARAVVEHSLCSGDLRLRCLLFMAVFGSGRCVSEREVGQALGSAARETNDALEFLRANRFVEQGTPEQSNVDGPLWALLPIDGWKVPRRGAVPARLLQPELAQELIEPEPNLAAEVWNLTRAKELLQEDLKDGGCRATDYNARFASKSVAGGPSPRAQLVPSSARMCGPPSAPGGAAPHAQLASLALAQPCTKEALAIGALQPATSARPQGEEALAVLRELSPQEFDRYSDTWRSAALKDGKGLLELARYGASEVRRRQAAGDQIRRPLAYLLPRARERGLV